MGMQIPCRLHSEISAEGVVWEIAAASGKVFRELARQKECEIAEGHLFVDHMHMLVRTPPKYVVSQVVTMSFVVRRQPAIARAGGFV